MSGDYTVIWQLLCIIKALAGSIGEKDRDMLPAYLENEHQQSVNDVWLCIMGNLRMMRP